MNFDASIGINRIETKREDNSEKLTVHACSLNSSPAPTPELKGKVLDCIEKGYYLNDKVMRFAKVVVGE